MNLGHPGTRVRAACAAIGRDPAGMCWSNALVLRCGRVAAEVMPQL